MFSFFFYFKLFLFFTLMYTLSSMMMLKYKNPTKNFLFLTFSLIINFPMKQQQKTKVKSGENVGNGKEIPVIIIMFFHV